MVDGNWKDGCLGTGWMDGMIGDRIKFFFQLNWFNMHGVLIFLFECTKRRSQSHVVFCFFGSEIWQQNRKQGLSCFRGCL